MIIDQSCASRAAKADCEGLTGDVRTWHPFAVADDPVGQPDPYNEVFAFRPFERSMLDHFFEWDCDLEEIEARDAHSVNSAAVGCQLMRGNVSRNTIRAASAL